jgi:hypothetical protein
MALRNQPYIPLYVQDVLTDEKLIECSAEAHGVYFRLLCILHKQEVYGLLRLKEKYKQTQSKPLAKQEQQRETLLSFADMLSKQMPFPSKQIYDCLQELINERVLMLNGDSLSQKRMVKDGELSLIRTKTGKLGGSKLSKQYGKQGFLYFMSDCFSKHKIGISSNTKNRLYRLRSDYKLPDSFDIIQQIPVTNMGKAEDIALHHFKDNCDGEWLNGDFQFIKNHFALLEAKLKANDEAKVEANSEYENENESENESEDVFGV